MQDQTQDPLDNLVTNNASRAGESKASEVKQSDSKRQSSAVSSNDGKESDPSANSNDRKDNDQPPPAGGGGGGLNRGGLSSAQEKRFNAYATFFRTLAGKIGQDNMDGVFRNQQALNSLNVNSDRELNETWWKPLQQTTESWVRDALNYVDRIVGKGRITFMDHIRDHDMMFVNLVTLLRWKGRNRHTQQVWPKDSQTAEDNQDLRKIACYYLALFKRGKV